MGRCVEEKVTINVESQMEKQVLLAAIALQESNLMSRIKGSVEAPDMEFTRRNLTLEAQEWLVLQGLRSQLVN